MGMIRLRWWRDALAELASGTVREHPVLQGLGTDCAALVPVEEFERLIDARMEDLEGAPPATGAILKSYARETGGVLMRIAARMLDSRDDLLDVALDIGEGVALAGILRSIPFHASQGKCFLPQNLLDQMAIDPAEMGQGKSLGLEVVVMVIAREAQRLLETPLPSAAAASIAAFLPARPAMANLRRLQRLGYDPYQPGNAAPFPFRALSMGWSALTPRFAWLTEAQN